MVFCRRRQDDAADFRIGQDGVGIFVDGDARRNFRDFGPRRRRRIDDGRQGAQRLEIAHMVDAPLPGAANGNMRPASRHNTSMFLPAMPRAPRALRVSKMALAFLATIL